MPNALVIDVVCGLYQRSTPIGSTPFYREIAILLVPCRHSRSGSVINTSDRKGAGE